MAKIKTNKTRINTRHRPIIKKRYFNGEKVDELAREYGYNPHYLKKWLEGRATTMYVDDKGIKWRRCSTCRVYRIETENFPSNGDGYRGCNCYYCDRLRKKNQYTMIKNQGRQEEFLERHRKTWDKNKWKYNTRRKILKLIGYLDVNGKIICKQ